ncbi:universal stress protein [Hoeflea sp. CAU 1731]
MSYKTIVAVLRSESDCEPVLNASISLCSQNGAHLIGIHAEPTMRVAYTAPMEIPDPTIYQLDEEEIQKRSSLVEKKFRDRCNAEGVSFEWRSVRSPTGDGAVSAVSSAHCADIVVLLQRNPDNTNDYADLESLVFESGRPVLFVPYTGHSGKPVKSVLVAWNATRESTRAVFDALPLLMAAEKVEIFIVDPKDTLEQSASMAGAEIAATLSRHGINVTVSSQSSGGVPAASIIENRMSDTQADLLVMGAYSHSRIKEFLFGGVTHTLLDSMTNLTLMSR